MNKEFLEIVKYGEAVLETPAELISNIDDQILKLSEKMVETMYVAPGVGLAAPQVGRALSLITVDPTAGEDRSRLMVLLNPVIVERNGTFTADEGCLSFPGIFLPVERSFEILVRGITLDGKEIELEARDYLARILQHEIDHLNATLIIHHVSSLKRSLVKSEIRKLKKSGQW